jgi:hypothetical protein
MATHFKAYWTLHTLHQVQHYKFYILSHKCLCVFHLNLTNKTLIQGFRSSDVDAVSLGERFPQFRRNAALTRDRMDCWPLNMTGPRSFETSRTINPSYTRPERWNCDLKISVTEPVFRWTPAAFTDCYTPCYCVSWRHLLINVFQKAKLITLVNTQNVSGTKIVDFSSIQCAESK